MTRHLQPDPAEPYTREAVRTGHFSEEAIELFRNAGHPKKWRTQIGLHLEKSTISQEAGQYYDYFFRFQGVVRLHLIMHTNLVPASRALSDKLLVLIEHIRLCLNSDASIGSNLNMGAAKVLFDLARGNTVSPETLESEFGRAFFPTSGIFRLLLLDFTGDDDELSSYRAMSLGSLIENALVAVDGRRVLLLVQEAAFQSERLKSSLETYTTRYECATGISDPFGNIEDAHFAYLQADAALAFARESREKHPALTFQDVFCAWIIVRGSQDPDLAAYCARRSMPARILADGTSGGPERYHVLEVFLKDERRATVAAGHLNMHRTTVLYQVKRLEGAFGFDLADRKCRERIRAEYDHLAYDPLWKLD